MDCSLIRSNTIVPSAKSPLEARKEEFASSVTFSARDADLVPGQGQGRTATSTPPGVRNY